jgi:iron complex transport system permease protein
MAAMLFGGSNIGPREVLDILFTTDASNWQHTIFYQIRLPRLLSAGFAGALLAGAGVLSQGLFRNPLASPSIVGATSGATAFTSFLFFIGLASLEWWSVPAASIFGAGCTTALIIFLARSPRFSSQELLLAGFAISALMAALSSLFVSIAIYDHQKSGSMMYWLFGGFNSKGWHHVMGLGVFLVVSTFASLGIHSRLDLFSLGQDVAATSGVDISILRRDVILTMAFMVGGAVAVGGGIGFVGLIVPHIVRHLHGPTHKKLFFFSLMYGACLLILADLIGRTVIAPEEIQVGVLTALMGGPFFLAILLKSKKRGY